MNSPEKASAERPTFQSRMSLLGEMGRRSTMKASFENRNNKQSDTFTVVTLHDAIKANDIDLVHRCLAQGVGVDDKNGVRETAVFAAIRHNRKDIFELLVRSGADINQKNERDRTCLHEAIRKGRYDIVHVIVHTPGVKLDCASKSGKTSLHLAVITRKRDVVQALLNNGANPNVCCNNGRSPLHWAAINGDKETANLLLTAGANINEKTKHMTTPLIFASHNRGDEIVELLVFREAIISGENADGDTALKLVASHGNVKLLMYMLDQMVEQERPNLARVVLEITKIKDHIDKLDEIGVFRYIYSKLSAETSFEEEIGFEIIQILHSPIKFLNWLIKEDKELAESNLTKLLEKRFRSDTQERTILRFLLRLDFCIRKCADKHEVEYKSLMDLVYKVELAINRIFEGDHMDLNLNMWKLLMPADDHNYTDEDKLLGHARCFQEDNMINFCLNNQLKILFDKPQIANIVQKLFRTALREVVLPEKIESSFNLKSFRIRRSLNLRSCPAANYFLGFFTKAISIFFTGWISIHAYGNNFGADYTISGANVPVYGSEVWFIVFLMGQIIHEIGELADSDYSIAVYLQDEWNYFDIVEYLLCFLWLVLRFIPGQFSHARICLAVAAIPQCQGLLRFLSFYKPVGELLIVLKAMFGDLSIFLGIYILLMLGFGITFDGLFHRSDNTAFGSITGTFLLLFSSTVQNFDFNGLFATSNEAVNTIGPLLQICFVVMSSIVLLNLLIARMTNSHQRISNQALREWSFSQAKTVSNLLLWKEKNGMSMLPPPFNFISILFAMVDSYHMMKWDDGDDPNAPTTPADKQYISLAGTVSNAVLTMTVGTVLRFFHRLHRLLKRMRSRTNHLTLRQRLYILVQVLLMVLWYPVYDWFYLLREYEVHLLDRVKEGGVIVYDKLPANILSRLEHQQQQLDQHPHHHAFQRKGSTRMTALDGGESVKVSDGESSRHHRPGGKFSKSVDRIEANKFLRSTSKFYVGRNDNENSSYSMGYSLYSIGGGSSKAASASESTYVAKEANRFSLSRLQPFFIASDRSKRRLMRTKRSRSGIDHATGGSGGGSGGKGDEDDDDDDDDDSHHGDFDYDGGRENYGVGFRDWFQEKRADDGEVLEYESSSEDDDDLPEQVKGPTTQPQQPQPTLFPFEQRMLDRKVLRKPVVNADLDMTTTTTTPPTGTIPTNPASVAIDPSDPLPATTTATATTMQKAHSSGSASFYQELEKGMFSRGLAAESNDSGDENDEGHYGEVKQDEDFGTHGALDDATTTSLTMVRQPLSQATGANTPSTNNSGYDSGTGDSTNGVPNRPNNRVRLSRARVLLSDAANAKATAASTGTTAPFPPMETAMTATTAAVGRVPSTMSFNSTSMMFRAPPQPLSPPAVPATTNTTTTASTQQPKKLLRKPFASKLGLQSQSFSGPSFYHQQPSVMNMNNTSSVFNMGDALPSMMMLGGGAGGGAAGGGGGGNGGGRAPGTTLKAATPLTTNTAQRFASHFSVLDHQMWIMDDDKSKIFSPDDVEDILRIFLPSWNEKRDDGFGGGGIGGRAMSRSYSNLNDDDDRSLEGGGGGGSGGGGGGYGGAPRLTKTLRRSSYGRVPSPMTASRNLTPQFGDSMRFGFPSTQNLAVDREKEQTSVALREMKDEMRQIKAMFDVLCQQQQPQQQQPHSSSPRAGAGAAMFPTTMTPATAASGGRPHSRSMDAANSVTSAVTWSSSKPVSPRIPPSSGWGGAGGGHRVALPPPAPPMSSSPVLPHTSLPMSRSELMRAMRVDSQSSFGYLPFVPSHDDVTALSASPAAVDSSMATATAAAAAMAGSGGAVGIGAANLSTFPSGVSYPSLPQLSAASHEDYDHHVSSSLSRSTELSGPVTSHEPYLRPTAITDGGAEHGSFTGHDIAMTTVAAATTAAASETAAAVPPGSASSSLPQPPSSSSLSLNSPAAAHQLTALQGEFRHMQREVRHVMSNMQQLQADMAQLLRLMTASSAQAPPGTSTSIASHRSPHRQTPGGTATAQRQEQQEQQQRQQMFIPSELSSPSMDVSPQISASMSHSFSISDLPGIYNESSRSGVRDEINPVRLTTRPVPGVNPLATPKRASGTAQTLSPAAASTATTGPPAASAAAVAMATSIATDEDAAGASHWLHSPAVKLSSSPSPSTKTQRIASLEDEAHPEAQAQAQAHAAVGPELEVHIDEPLEKSSVADIPMTLTVSPPGMSTEDTDIHVQSMLHAAANLRRVRSSDSQNDDDNSSVSSGELLAGESLLRDHQQAPRASFAPENSDGA